MRIAASASPHIGQRMLPCPRGRRCTSWSCVQTSSRLICFTTCRLYSRTHPASQHPHAPPSRKYKMRSQACDICLPVCGTRYRAQTASPSPSPMLAAQLTNIQRPTRRLSVATNASATRPDLTRAWTRRQSRAGIIPIAEVDRIRATSNDLAPRLARKRPQV